ncbi:PREDICTED: uncharacterized protein LOC109589771 [Amphimedon queenslandica]|uniref:Mediator of RNA polymerase II transcription subunit 16 n=1 Tax=Amphimedon queenslandica TaxID=400682 RepID=A0AAN0JVZ9_AMPQE|nr:PREDICTED: uncharacterized protein LOC109589771 [Amphimedon queenslandica]|eukprot:XP_019861350.1 PREDICTED: uncharacterized protein LOC109589771 [Amphimedon queenslandica]
MAKRESLYIIHHPVSAMTCTALCLKGCGTSPSSLVTTPAPGSEFMLDVTSESRDKNWPIELIVMLHTDNSITVLNRTSYQVLCNYKLGGGDGEPGAKRLKTEGDWGGAAGGVVNGDCNICISPNGGCVAVATEGVINVIAFSPFFLGEKGFESPDISRWSLLLALAAVKNVSVWDIAVMCSRVSYRHKDGGLIMKVLEQWGKDFTRNSDTWRDTLLPVYYRICLTLHCCHDHGLTHALDQRDVLRLHSTFSLFLLSLSSNKESDSSLAYSLKDCAESPEDNIDAITRSLQNKDFEIDKDIASELQVHAHWIIEFSLKVSSRIANLMVGRYPDRLSLKVLRQCLMLIFIWNKVLKMPVLSISDSSLSLLFKVITCTINNEMNVLDESLKSDLLRNIPPMESYSTLTLTKAANLQGFLHGLSKTAELPETFYREIPPRLRPHVQANYSSYDPYSPLGLVVPKGISPPWRDRFIEGQLDVIHGGILTNAVLRDTKLRQCSNCRSWTVVSGTSAVDPATPSSLSSPIQQWRHSWTRHCLCGSMWLHTKQ